MPRNRKGAGDDCNAASAQDFDQLASRIDSKIAKLSTPAQAQRAGGRQISWRIKAHCALRRAQDELADARDEIDRLEIELWRAQRDAEEARRVMGLTEEAALRRRG